MIARAKRWWVVAAVFTFFNVGGVIWGAIMGDAMHAMGHVALQLVGYVVWKLTASIREEDPPALPPVDERRIEYLQQSVDAIALEVERLGEKQRFAEKLQVRGGEPPDGRS